MRKDFLAFDHRCYHCHGNGTVYTPPTDLEPRHCVACNGTGSQPNATGSALLDFLRRHLSELSALEDQIAALRAQMQPTPPSAPPEGGQD